MLPSSRSTSSSAAPASRVEPRYPGGDEPRRRSPQHQRRRRVATSRRRPARASSSTRSRATSTVSDINGASRSRPSAATSGSVERRAARDAKSISGDVEIADTKIDGALEPERQRHREAAGSEGAQLALDDRQRQRRHRQTSLAERVDAQAISGNVAFTRRPRAERPLRVHFALGQHPHAVRRQDRVPARGHLVQRSIRTDLPVTMGGAEPDGKRPRSLRGTYGDGSASSTLTTFSGTSSSRKDSSAEPPHDMLTVGFPDIVAHGSLRLTPGAVAEIPEKPGIFSPTAGTLLAQV